MDIKDTLATALDEAVSSIAQDMAQKKTVGMSQKKPTVGVKQPAKPAETKSLADRMAEHECEAKTPENCPLVKEAKKQGMSDEEALRMHNSSQKGKGDGEQANKGLFGALKDKLAGLFGKKGQPNAEGQQAQQEQEQPQPEQQTQQPPVKKLDQPEQVMVGDKPVVAMTEGGKEALQQMQAIKDDPNTPEKVKNLIDREAEKLSTNPVTSGAMKEGDNVPPDDQLDKSAEEAAKAQKEFNDGAAQHEADARSVQGQLVAASQAYQQGKLKLQQEYNQNRDDAAYAKKLAGLDKKYADEIQRLDPIVKNDEGTEESIEDHLKHCKAKDPKSENCPFLARKAAAGETIPDSAKQAQQQKDPNATFQKIDVGDIPEQNETPNASEPQAETTKQLTDEERQAKITQLRKEANAARMRINIEDEDWLHSQEYLEAKNKIAEADRLEFMTAEMSDEEISSEIEKANRDIEYWDKETSKYPSIADSEAYAKLTPEEKEKIHKVLGQAWEAHHKLNALESEHELRKKDQTDQGAPNKPDLATALTDKLNDGNEEPADAGSPPPPPPPPPNPPNNPPNPPDDEPEGESAPPPPPPPNPPNNPPDDNNKNPDEPKPPTREEELEQLEAERQQLIREGKYDGAAQEDFNIRKQEILDRHKGEPEEHKDPTPEKGKFGELIYDINGKKYIDATKLPPRQRALAEYAAWDRGDKVLDNLMKVLGKWDRIMGSDSRYSLRSATERAIALDYANRIMSRDVWSEEEREQLGILKRKLETSQDENEQYALHQQLIGLMREKKEDLGLTDPNAKASANVNANIARSANDIHKNGGVTTADMRVGANGVIEKDAMKNLPPPPPVTILKKPEVKKGELKDAKTKIGNALQFLKEQGINYSDYTVTTNANDTKLTVTGLNEFANNAIGRMGDSLRVRFGENNIRIVPDIGGQKCDIYVANTTKGDVSLYDIMDSDDWKEATKTMGIPMAVGRTNEGKAVIYDARKDMHLIIAGASGWGKSVSLNSMITSATMAKSPDELKLLLIDPKNLEFKGKWDGSKHLAMPVAVSKEESLQLLQYGVSEMDNRTQLMTGYKTLEDYNKMLKEKGEKPLPELMIVIDEGTDLLDGNSECRALLKRLGNKCRAVGIRVVLATQDPKIENIGDIKKNFSSQLGFYQSERSASNSLFGDDRATKLTRRGEFILKRGGDVVSGQGAMSSEEDIDRDIGYWNGEKFPEEETPSPEGTQPAEEGTKNPESNPTSENPENGSQEHSAGNGSAISPAPAAPEPTPEEIEAKKKAEAEEAERKRSPFETIHNPENRQARAKAIAERKIAELESGLNHGKITEAEYSEQIRDAENAYNQRIKDIEEGLSGEDIAAREKKAQEENATQGGAEQKQPATEKSEEEQPAQPEKRTSPFDDVYSPEKRRERAKSIADQRIAELGKQLDKGKISESEYNAEMKKAKSEYDQRMKDIDDGLSDDAISERDQKAKAEEDAKNEARRNSIVTSIKGKPIPGAKSGVYRGNKNAMVRLNAQESKQRQAALPQGFQLDGDGRPVKDGFGKTYARNPVNGSYGYVDNEGKFHIMVDTTHPKYKGRNSEEAKALQQRMSKAHGQRREALKKEYNNVAFGIDEAIDMRSVLDSAITAYFKNPKKAFLDALAKDSNVCALDNAIDAYYTNPKKAFLEALDL